MKIVLREPLSFIRKADLKEFYIEHRNGANIIVAGDFSQNIKASEYEKIIAANIQKPPVVRQKTARELKAEADAQAKLEKEQAEAKAAADAAQNNGDQSNKPSEKL